jgi:hypothetical protein
MPLLHHWAKLFPTKETHRSFHRTFHRTFHLTFHHISHHIFLHISHRTSHHLSRRVFLAALRHVVLQHLLELQLVEDLFVVVVTQVVQVVGMVNVNGI